MTNPTQQRLHRHTHTHSPGDPGCLQVRDPCVVALPLGLLPGGFSAHHHNAEEIYKRGRKKTHRAPGAGKSRALTLLTVRLTEASPARAPRPTGRALGPSVKQRPHLLSRLGKLRLTGYENLRDLTELSWGLPSSLSASLRAPLS